MYSKISHLLINYFVYFDYNEGVNLLTQLKECFAAVQFWMRKYYLAMNDNKTQIIIFGPTSVLKEITENGVNIGSCNITIRSVA